MKTIKATISPQGEVEIETTGFKGAACELATKELEKALGTTTRKKKSPEYYAATVGQQKAGAS